MKIARLLLLGMTFAPGAAVLSIASAQSVPPQLLNGPPKAGPSLGNATPTPSALTQQSKDDKMTQTIQQTLQQDEKLSPLVKNVQISTDGGIVTLTGQVVSLDDQEKVVDAVSQIVGASNIRNQLQIAGEKPFGPQPAAGASD
jgi:osmotically-inducible protein OsmY